MAHFNFVISQNAKWGHAGFYIDCHRMPVPENILLQKSTAHMPYGITQCYLPSVRGDIPEKAAFGTYELNSELKCTLRTRVAEVMTSP